MKKREKNLGMWVCHAARLFRRRMDQSIADAEADAEGTLSGRSFWVLQYLKDHEGEAVYQRDLERNFKVRRSTVSNMIDLLEKKGLLTRESCGDDARLKRLRLTDRAETLLLEVTDGTERFEARLRESFTPDDYETLMRLLEQLYNTLETMPECNEREETDTTHA